MAEQKIFFEKQFVLDLIEEKYADATCDGIQKAMFDLRQKFADLPGCGTMYGYNIEELAVFAYACKIQGVEEYELHNFVRELITVAEIVYKDLDRTMKESLRIAFGGDKDG